MRRRPTLRVLLPEPRLLVKREGIRQILTERYTDFLKALLKAEQVVKKA